MKLPTRRWTLKPTYWHNLLLQAIFPATNIGYQMGEATQIHSGGLLRATPHCVRGISGPSASRVSRATLAVFMQPQWDEPMDLPPGVVPEEVEVGAWTPGLDFGAFTERTISKNYVKI
jgi:isopenicillin N synthase-like dioxygenase